MAMTKRGAPRARVHGLDAVTGPDSTTTSSATAGTAVSAGRTARRRRHHRPARRSAEGRLRSARRRGRSSRRPHAGQSAPGTSRRVPQPSHPSGTVETTTHRSRPASPTRAISAGTCGRGARGAGAPRGSSPDPPRPSCAGAGARSSGCHARTGARGSHNPAATQALAMRTAIRTPRAGCRDRRNVTGSIDGHGTGAPATNARCGTSAAR